MPSIRNIAKELGVSPSTVSRALRRTGRISPELCEKIRAAAERLGYEVNPLLAKAFSLSRQVKRCRETIAFVLEYPTETGPDYQKAMHRGAEARASGLGYKLEPVVLSKNPSDHRRWSKIFVCRGIRAVIVVPRLEHPQPSLAFDWKRFASVEIGRTLFEPYNLHRVETSEYHKTIQAVGLLREAGYRGIGMAVEPRHNEHRRWTYYAAFFAAQQMLPERERIPILALEGGWTEANFGRWMRKYKPDVLLAHHVPVICKWLNKMKLRIPEDISVFNVNVRNSESPGLHQAYEWSGLLRDDAGMGRRAVDLISSLLESGEIGLVGNPICLQVDEFWAPGQTLARPISRYINSDGFLRAESPLRNGAALELDSIRLR